MKPYINLTHPTWLTDGEDDIISKCFWFHLMMGTQQIHQLTHAYIYAYIDRIDYMCIDDIKDG